MHEHVKHMKSACDVQKARVVQFKSAKQSISAVHLNEEATILLKCLRMLQANVSAGQPTLNCTAALRGIAAQRAELAIRTLRHFVGVLLGRIHRVIETDRRRRLLHQPSWTKGHTLDVTV